MTERWAIAQVWCGHEYRLRDRIDRLGHRVWLPECEVKRQNRRKVEVSLKLSLFPGYLFVGLGAVPWREIEGLPGVVELLKQRGGERLAYLPSVAAAELRRKLDAAGGVLVINEDRFAENQRVRITGGPFAGWEGLYRSRVKDRINVLLDILGRQVETQVSEALVEPA